MTRGRKPDTPAHQTAKGSPGKRRMAQTEAAAVAIAESDPVNPPDFLKTGRRRGALVLAYRIWRELAPHLRRRNLLDRLDRYAFARWCTYQAEWIEATRTIAKEGLTRMVKTVSGDEMPRRHPAAMHRDRIEMQMANLEAAYGLTPADRYKVMRDQAAAPLGGLFADRGEEPDRKPATESMGSGPVGFLADRSKPPPGTRPN